MSDKIKDKTSLLPAILADLFLCFTLFIFAPIDMYLANIADFWFELSQFWWISALCFIMAFLVIFFIVFVCRQISDKLYNIVTAVGFGASLAIYLQGTFLSIGLSSLDGSVPDWGAQTKSIVINTFVWAVIILAPTILLIIKKNFFISTVKFAAVILTLTQLVTLTISLIGSPLDYKNNINIYLSTNDQFVLSDKNNVVMIMIDTMGTKYFDKVLDKNPEYLSEFDGFTYYRNMSGSYRKTVGAVMYWFTGQYYLNEQPFVNYCNEAFAKNELFSDLKNANYDVRIFDNGNGIYYNEGLSDQIDNLEKSRFYFKSTKRFAINLYKFVAYRYGPSICRPVVYDNYMDKFDSLKLVGNKKAPPYSASTAGFYSKLKSDPITVQSDKNAFRFYVLTGSHSPYNLNEKAETVEEGTVTYYEQTLGSLTAASEYLAQMKKLGIYDSSTIIVLADHGHGPLDSNPTFLIKEANKTGDLSVSDAPVSHEDMRATIIKAAGLDYKKYGTPVDEWPLNAKRERKYYVYSWTRIEGFNYYFEDITEYKVTGNATDLKSYESTGNVYSAKK